MTPDLTLTVHDPTTLGLAERLAVARLDVACTAFAYPDEPPKVVMALAEKLLHAGADDASRVVLAHAGGALVGQATVGYSLSQNTDKAFLNVMVYPDARRAGVGRALALRAGEVALELGRTSYTAATSSRGPQGAEFAARLAARPALATTISELRMDALNWKLLRRWVARPDPDAYALRLFSRVPEEELERVAAVFGVMNTAPRGDMDFEDWVTTPAMIRSQQEAWAASGERALLYVVEHLESRQFVGFTDVQWHPQRATLVFQGGTGVRPDHRGRGLGKWLKAAMLLHLPSANSQARRVRTGNADSNAAMLGINCALGFVAVFEQTGWQGDTLALLSAAHEAIAGTNG